jgi:hypothetical protein
MKQRPLAPHGRWCQSTLTAAATKAKFRPYELASKTTKDIHGAAAAAADSWPVAFVEEPHDQLR